MAQALRRAIMEDGDGSSDAEPVAMPCLAERLHAFRSLGGNCEFGFVQRYVGAEPSGLLRFSYTPIDDLIHALDTDFAAYGAPGDLRVAENEGGTYYCVSRRYNIWSNTAQRVEAVDPAVLLEREYGRVAHLKRRMLAELADGSKILVRKLGQGESETDLARLAQAIGRHGPSPLLRVTEAGSAWTPAPVRRIADRILQGCVRRFAPTELAWDLDLEPWLRLCDSAYAAVHGVPEADFPSEPSADIRPLPARLRRHRGRNHEAGFKTFRMRVDPAAFDPDGIQVFSAWVWIPEDVSASRIFALAGRERLGAFDADLSVRGRWQRVWAAGRIGRDLEGDPPVGLAMVGGRADRFWSCGWRLQTGPIPRPAAPPDLAVAPSRLRWFTGWLGSGLAR